MQPPCLPVSSQITITNYETLKKNISLLSGVNACAIILEYVSFASRWDFLKFWPFWSDQDPLHPFFAYFDQTGIVQTSPSCKFYWVHHIRQKPPALPPLKLLVWSFGAARSASSGDVLTRYTHIHATYPIHARIIWSNHGSGFFMFLWFQEQYPSEKRTAFVWLRQGICQPLFKKLGVRHGSQYPLWFGSQMANNGQMLCK
jgi:hypothetical protein